MTVKGIEKTFEEQLMSLGLFNPEKRRLRGDLMVSYSSLVSRRAGTDLWRRTRGNTGLELHRGGSGVGYQKGDQALEQAL